MPRPGRRLINRNCCLEFSDDDSDDDEDETAALMAELNKIKQERAEEKARQASSKHNLLARFRC